MNLNPLLKRQLLKSNIELNDLPDDFKNLLSKVSRTYNDFDQSRYTYERSIDISSNEMRNLRNRLETERQYIQSIMSEGFCILGSSHTIKNINKESERLLNMLNEEVEGKPFYDVFTLYNIDNNQQRVPLKLLSNKIEKNETIKIDRCLIKCGDDRIPISFCIYPLPTLQNSFYNGAIIVMRDISVNINYEESLKSIARKACKENDAKSLFLANMSHEIRSPMHGILGTLGLLTNTPLSPEQQHYTNMCSHAANGLLKIIDDILNKSKLDSGNIEIERVKFSLLDELDSIFNLFIPICSEKGIDFNIEYDSNLPLQVKSDPVRLRQVINNLLSNAVKFTPQGGNINVKVNYRIDETEHFIRFSVADSGIGIPKESQEKIFDSFAQADSSTTRKYGGTGLGLAITRKIVELMDGWIKVVSNPNEGATFIVQLKINICAPNTLPAPQTTKPREEFRDVHILIVEDNPINMEIAKSMLGSLGCSISCAENGQIALDLLETHSYDLIFMDCQMPIVDGFTATEVIRNKEKHLNITNQCPDYNKIIALTANAFDSDHEACLNAGMDDYLSKPFDMSGLVRILNAHLPEKKYVYQHDHAAPPPLNDSNLNFDQT